MTRFSILIPTHNRFELLKYAVETVRGQNFSDWEIIISDNFSDEPIGSYVESLGESRIKYSRTASFISVTENWNRALAESAGEYVIMLGDDDGLLRGSLTELDRLARSHQSPDFIFTDTLQFTYPKVFPDQPRAYVQRGYADFFDGRQDQPYFLERTYARSLVLRSFNFRLPFVYNMQQSIVRRSLINRLAAFGPFFQSPYPDYYATNSLFLNAEKILINPSPLLIIGLSRKSFGCFYFNNKEKDGNLFLNNGMDVALRQSLERWLVPGSEMNNSWLAAMETLKNRFGRLHHVKVNYRRYRLIQLMHLYQKNGAAGVLPLLPFLTYFERKGYAAVPVVARWLRRHLAAENWKALEGAFVRWAQIYPAYDSQLEMSDAKDILDLFGQAEISDPKFRRRVVVKTEYPTTADLFWLAVRLTVKMLKFKIPRFLRSLPRRLGLDRKVDEVDRGR